MTYVTWVWVQVSGVVMCLGIKTVSSQHLRRQGFIGKQSQFWCRYYEWEIGTKIRELRFHTYPFDKYMHYSTINQGLKGNHSNRDLQSALVSDSIGFDLVFDWILTYLVPNSTIGLVYLISMSFKQFLSLDSKRVERLRYFVDQV